MAVDVPDIMFRIITNRSNGTNSPSRFNPAGIITAAPNALRGSKGTLLQAALIGRDLPQCPFIFFTSSLLFALVFADFRKQKGDTNIRIVCIDTRRARTAEGTHVRFHLVDQLMQEWGVEVRNGRDDSIREYTGEWVSMSSVIAGEGSCSVAFETLIENGLYDLYPALDEVKKGRKNRGAKLYVPTSMLRQHGFARQRGLSEGEIDVAARLVGCFSPSTKSDGMETTRVQLMAWILSLQKRKVDDVVLRNWILAHSIESTTNSKSTPIVIDDAEGHNMPEMDQYCELHQLLSGRHINPTAFTATRASIDHATVRKGVADWEAWRVKNREERYKSRVAGPPREGGRRVKRRDRERSPRGGKDRLGVRPEGGRKRRQRGYSARKERSVLDRDDGVGGLRRRRRY